MTEGGIYSGKNNRRGRHPIVFLNDIDEYSFEGLMLTHSSISDNQLLSEEHFEHVEKNFDTRQTHFVRRRLIKKNEWKPFIKVGQLSATGIALVRERTKDTELSYFD